MMMMEKNVADAPIVDLNELIDGQKVREIVDPVSGDRYIGDGRGRLRSFGHRICGARARQGLAHHTCPDGSRPYCRYRWAALWRAIIRISRRSAGPQKGDPHLALCVRYAHNDYDGGKLAQSIRGAAVSDRHRHGRHDPKHPRANR